MSSWLEECKAQSPKTVLTVLVGNKVDLADKREVTTKEGQDFAAKNKMLFFECSAKTGLNIEEVFYESAKIIVKKIEDNYYDLTSETCGIKRGIGGGDLSGRPSWVLKKDNGKKKKKKCC